MAQGRINPRSNGTFPRVFRYYTLEERVLSLEEAAKKMTSAPANRLGLIDRGVIRERSWADLDIFNNHTVANQATDIDSPSYPVLILGVIVNGVVVIDRSRHTDNLPGHVL